MLEIQGDLVRMKVRNHNLDLMRVVLCIFVIAFHSLYHFGIENEVVFELIGTLLVSTNGLFYMISGYFNLEKEFNNIQDIKEYYKKRFIDIIFPFLAFVFVWTIWDYYHATGSFNVGDILSTYYRAIVDTSSDGHMWFMYPLFGMLLSTPFLSKMLHSMDEKELKLLWYIAIGYNIVAYYFCWDQGIGFSFLCWFLEGWAIFYFAGYYYRHVIAKESPIKWAILGIFAYAFTILGNRGFFPFFNTFEDSSSIQPMFTIYCVACFMFWDKAVKIKDGKFASVITFLSKNTYMVYLYHLRGIEYVIRKLNLTENNFVSGLLIVIGGYLISLLLAYVTNLCLKPVQKLLSKVL